MTKKQIFVSEISELIKDHPLSEDAMTYFNGLVVASDIGKAKLTINGKIVLKFMQENKDTYNNLFKAKDIGEALGIASRTISGGFRKLVSDGYAEKIGEGTPVVYALTKKGDETNPDEE